MNIYITFETSGIFNNYFFSFSKYVKIHNFEGPQGSKKHAFLLQKAIVNSWTHRTFGRRCSYCYHMHKWKPQYGGIGGKWQEIDVYSVSVRGRVATTVSRCEGSLVEATRKSLEVERDVYSIAELYSSTPSPSRFWWCRDPNTRALSKRSLTTLVSVGNHTLLNKELFLHLSLNIPSGRGLHLQEDVCAEREWKHCCFCDC